MMVGFEFSRSQGHVPKKTPNMIRKGSENEANILKTSAGSSFLDAMKALAKKVSKKSQEPGSGSSRELAWVPLIKRSTESQESYKGSIGGTGIVQGIMKRPLVPEGTVAD